MGFVLFDELPDGFVGFFFANAVGYVRVLGLLGVFYCELVELLVLRLFGVWTREGRGANW